MPGLFLFRAFGLSVLSSEPFDRFAQKPLRVFPSAWCVGVECAVYHLVVAPEEAVDLVHEPIAKIRKIVDVGEAVGTQWDREHALIIGIGGTVTSFVLPNAQDPDQARPDQRSGRNAGIGEQQNVEGIAVVSQCVRHEAEGVWKNAPHG